MTVGFGKRLRGADYGLMIDETKPLTFTFDGKLHNGFEGDVIASALLAEGRAVLSRSFKYHRPRGVLSMAGHDANTLVQVAEEPNVRADRHRLTGGLAVSSINKLGSLDWDFLSALGALSRFLPVGFYYKTFYRPSFAWKYFERPIRNLAGLGRLEPRAHHKYYDKAYLFCEVLVVGGGQAGLSAAIAAAEAGADTLLVDEWPELGGSLLFGRGESGRAETVRARQALVAQARRLPSLKILTDTTVSGLFADNWASAIGGSRLYKIRSKQTIVATGAFDQPAVFANNDRPGIMFADAAQRLMRLYGVVPGCRAVVLTSNRFGYEAALDLLDAGVEVAAIIDLTGGVQTPSAEELRHRGVRVVANSAVVGSEGAMRLERVAVAPLQGDGRAATRVEWFNADHLVMAVGYSPAVNLASHAGASVAYDPAINMHRATSLPQGVSIAGSAAGVWNDDAARANGASVGLAAGLRARGAVYEASPAPEASLGDGITHPYPIFPSANGKEFVDLDEDLKINDIVNTVKDGYDDIQLVKRYSTAGFGPSQGRGANLNTIRIVAKETGKSLEAIGTTTYRPPLVPEKFAHMAGRAFEPVRHTAMHARHLELGARMMTAGLWLRPASYPTARDDEDAAASEALNVRTGVGIIDVSTLGGLDVRGPDAAAFLERMYTGAFARQPVGRGRYALMCDMSGVIIDDGVAARLHERHFYVTATTGAVDQVYRAMSWLNAQWKMDVDVANVTAAYAAVNLAGPRARDVIAKLATDIDFAASAFPYMGVRVGHLAGIPVRVMRVGFVGELGYEIHCPTGFGECLWDALMEAGKPVGICPFGVEAQRLLRLEKGHIIVGQDTDGLTSPLEANMEWALAEKKDFYVGKRSMTMLRARAQSRKLVGFEVTAKPAPEIFDCNLIIKDQTIVGRITSVVRSPTLGITIGLCYLPPDLALPGQAFEIRTDQGEMVAAEVVATPFYDPLNARQEAL